MKPMDSNLEILDTIHSETNEYLQDLTFFKGDIVFLRLALDRYFRRIMRIENPDQLRGCLDRFKEMEICHKNLLQQLKQHLTRIDLASKQESTVFNSALVEVHLNFCSRMTQFISEYQFLRTEILRVASDHPEEGHDMNSSTFSGHILSSN